MSAYIGHCSLCGDEEAVIDTMGYDNAHVCIECLKNYEYQLLRQAMKAARRRAERDAVVRDQALQL